MIWAATGQSERAAELLYFVRAQPQSWQETKDWAKAQLDKLDLPTETLAAAQTRGEQFQLDDVMAKVLSGQQLRS